MNVHTIESPAAASDVTLPSYAADTTDAVATDAANPDVVRPGVAKPDGEKPAIGMPDVVVRRFAGLAAYEPVWRAMQSFTDARTTLTLDEIWVVEHAPVFTLGQAGKWEHVLMPGDIPVVPVDRGGQVTYHGPGQIVAYPLIDLRRLRLGVRDLVCRIEQAIIDTLAVWNIVAERKAGAPGVYVAGAKVAALGLRVRRGCSFHGLAFNVNMDLSPFHRINPCGFEGLAVTQVMDLGGPSRLADVEGELVGHLARLLGLRVRFAPAPVTDDAGKNPAAGASVQP